MAWQWVVFKIFAAWIISNILSSMLAEDIEEPAAPEEPITPPGVTGTRFKLTTRSTQEPIKVVYGLQRVGGNDVYGFTKGNNNHYLYLVQALAEGVCSSINQVSGVDQIWLNDELYTEYGENITKGTCTETKANSLVDENAKFTEELRTLVGLTIDNTTDDTEATINAIVSDTELTLSADIFERTEKYEIVVDDANVRYVFHDGASDQVVDTMLNTATSDWTERMENTCYIVFELHWDKDKFKGVPKRQVELKGLEVHDIRDSTAADAWSDNPVLCLYDYMTNPRYGMGIDTAKFDVDSWSAAANYCDSKSFTCNLVVDNVKDVISVIDSITKLFRGKLRWFDGMFYLVFSDTTDSSNDSVMTIENKHVFQDEGGKAAIGITQPGRFNRPDGLRVKFIDKDNSYTVDDVIVGDQLGVVNEFGLLGCTNKNMAMNLGYSSLERNRLDRTIGGVFRDECILLQPHDVVVFNNTTLGISDQEMRVISADAREDSMVDLVLKYESDDIYDIDYDVGIEDKYICDLPNPSTEPPNVINHSIEEESYYYRLVTYSRLKIDFNPPSNYPWYDHVEVWIAITDVGDPKPTQADYKHQFNTTNQFEFDPVDEGKKYWIKLVSVNYWDVKATWDNSISLEKTIIGKSGILPDSLESLGIIVNDDSIYLIADKLLDPDIEVYEFRLGSQWSGGIFMASLRSPNYSIKGVKPGTHTFCANSLGSNDLYGVTPRCAAGRVYPPKGWTLHDDSTYTDDYTDGTHVNTEYVFYSDDDYLKCSHLAGNFSGEYTSPEFDVGVADIYYAYIDAEIVVTGVGTRWEDVFAIDGTSLVAIWTDIGIQTRTWSEIFAVEKAPSVRITLRWKKNIGDDWSETTRMEICSTTIEARYFQVVIEIEDPSNDINALVENFIIVLYN